MAEIRFVLKGLVLAVLVTMLLQVRIGGETLEIKSDRWIHHSAVGEFLNHTASGAVLVIKRGTKWVEGFYSRTFGSSREGTKESWRIETRHHRVRSTEPSDEDGE